jgi:hypothetical protein
VNDYRLGMHANWRKVVYHFAGRCCACGAIGTPDRHHTRAMTKDHIVPRSHGGTLRTDNLQPLCGHCNSDKGDTVVDYRPLALAHMGTMTLTQRQRAGREIERMIAADPSLWTVTPRPPRERLRPPTLRQQRRRRNAEARLRAFVVAYRSAEGDDA